MPSRRKENRVVEELVVKLTALRWVLCGSAICDVLVRDEGEGGVERFSRWTVSEV
jgi:hypothetical protein